MGPCVRPTDARALCAGGTARLRRHLCRLPGWGRSVAVGEQQRPQGPYRLLCRGGPRIGQCPWLGRWFRRRPRRSRRPRCHELRRLLDPSWSVELVYRRGGAVDPYPWFSTVYPWCQQRYPRTRIDGFDRGWLPDRVNAMADVRAADTGHLATRLVR